jgi:hypothetical protein
MRAEEVKEIQGLYGPFTLTERVLQKVWLRQDFITENLKTASGRSLEVVDPGRWNLLDGPDFKEARLILDGESIVADVEVHFSASDWYSHQHERNAGYNRVRLHVVLYTEPGESTVVKTEGETEPELLVLMPLLERDLESYATDEALLDMEQVDEVEWIAEFLEKPIEQRRLILKEQADRRWSHKLQFAQKRLAGSSWEESCHQFCLEVLGYSRNRAPMSHLALHYPLETMRSADLSPESLFEEVQDTWKLSGLRPANHPRRRLQQYLEIVKRNPQWPAQLRQVFEQAPVLSSALATGVARRMIAIPKPIGEVRDEVFKELVGESRFHTMMVDAFLPLAAAAEIVDGHAYWWHWWAGDCPSAVRRFLKHTEITGKDQPLSNGLVQGALALFINRGL